MNINDLFPRRYASAEELQGKEATLTIFKVALEKMRPNAQSPEMQKLVVYFSPAGKGVVTSKTLAHQIAEIVGSEETDDWRGKAITLYPEAVTVAGKRMTVFRAKRPKPGAAAPQGAPSAFAGDDEAEH